MAELGILAPDEQVELIAGPILQKKLKGSAHRVFCKHLGKFLEQRLGRDGRVCLQDPIPLDDDSEPEPDLAVVWFQPTFYADQHPCPEDIQ